ncbi:MAG: hypothetical protein R3F19_32205 [Verrucomicrobiales bacterium]
MLALWIADDGGLSGGDGSDVKQLNHVARNIAVTSEVMEARLQNRATGLVATPMIVFMPYSLPALRQGGDLCPVAGTSPVSGCSFQHSGVLKSAPICLVLLQQLILQVRVLSRVCAAAKGDRLRRLRRIPRWR